jgi:TGF-beta receptor type-1
MKILRCYCNDEILCPVKKYLEQKLEITNTNNSQDDIIRHCSTNTVCLTKRLRRLNGTTWLKYFCDQSSSESIRSKVIEYRDCKINSTNKHDKQQAEKSSEYCCDSHDYCNKYLNPINSVKDIEEIKLLKLNEYNSIIKQEIFYETYLISPVNLALLSSLFLFMMTMAFIFIYFIYSLNRKMLKSKFSDKKKEKMLNNFPLIEEKEISESTGSSSKSTTTNTTTTTTTNIIRNNLKTVYKSYLDQNNNALNEAFESNSECNNKITFITSDAENYDENFSIPSSIVSSSGIGTASQSNSDCNYDWSGSGSGAGVPQLLQRTIARQIKLIYPCIGKGRFGEVYKGMWRDEYVAVKTFNSADEKSWQNECNIYNTNGFRHENILGFIASDNIDRGTYTELWIITEFHSNGSLFDYLNQNTLTIYECLKMAISIVNGLDHLHTPIESCTGKPALAHCDLKSKNILVKSDLTCCIGDLGLALCGDKNGNIQHHYQQQQQQQQYYSNSNNDDIITIRTGTKRYMAPEILNKTINIKSLYQFQNAEMYSLALIFWELLTRTKFELLNKIYIYEYKLPYYQYLPMDPNDLQMKQIVCEQKLRPEINYLWKQINIMNELTQLTEELWVENSNGRLNALRLKKSLNSIMRKNCLAH